MTNPNSLLTSSISDLALIIANDWKKVNFAARPYLDAMFGLSSVDENYGFESGRSIVLYFLNNATSWKGDTAKAVKAELKARLKR
jgi:hypothetical protein